MKQSPEKPRNIAFILRKVELYKQGLLCFQKNSSATLEKAIFFKKEAFQISVKSSNLWSSCMQQFPKHITFKDMYPLKGHT